jgi:hypothetical protein
MANSNDFDLNTFQEKVWKEYSSYERFSSSKSFERDLRDFKGGCLAFPFARLAVFLAKSAYRKISKDKNYTEFEKEAVELIGEPEIKKVICNSILNLPRQEILTEKRFVAELTKTLSDKKLIKKFVIPQNAVFYGIIAYQIFQQGLENYCKET